MKKRYLTLTISLLLAASGLFTSAPSYAQTDPAAPATTVQDTQAAAESSSSGTTDRTSAARTVSSDQVTIPAAASQGAGKDDIKKDIIRYSFLMGVPALTYFFAIYAWSWGDRSHWLWAHEGYFGEQTYQGGEDKFAHAFSHYLVMRAACNIFDYTENGHPRKWLYAGGLTLVLGLSIEVGDAYSGENGFSFEDITANMVGITLGYLLEKYPLADKFVGYSATYIPTRYYRDHPNMLWKFPDDYSGWKFMLNFKLAGFEYLGIKLPDFLRYVMLDVGFYARNYTKYDNHGLGEDKSLWRETRRYWFVGASVNMMEVVNSCFDRKASFWNSALQQPFKYYHVPAGYSIDTRID